MPIPKQIQFSLKMLLVLLTSVALIGGALIFAGIKSISWALQSYSNWSSQHVEKFTFVDSIQEFFTKPIPKNILPLQVVDEQSQVIEVVKKASPAVVSIIATAEVPTFETYFGDPSLNLPEELMPFFNIPIPQQRQNGTQKQQIGAGTGFLVSEDGYIVTNKHVVADEDAEYTVYLNDEQHKGEKIIAQVLARDPNNDLAIIKIDKTNLPYLSFDDSSELQVGQTAITIGYALGEFDNTVSKGVISGLSRTITAGGGGLGSETLKNLIQTDAAINPGNSGGPMLDLNGNVIGINVAMASAENIGFAILGNEAQNAFTQVQETGSIPKKELAYLGVRYVLINDQIQSQNNLSYDYGALVTRGETMNDLAVIPGSPADKAGIMENDIILEINGKKINSKNQLSDLIAAFKPGDDVMIKIFHKGDEKEVSVKLEKN